MVLAPSIGVADTKSPLQPTIGATESVKLVPPAGFIDDGIAVDDKRLAYVASESSGRAELHVLTFTPRSETTVDVGALTTHPTALAFVGNRVLVIGAGEDGKQVAGLFEPGAKATAPIYKLGPADHITLIARDGKQRVAVHRTSPGKDVTKHEVEIVALDNGKRVAAGPAFELDDKNANKAHELRVNHWADGYTRAFGLKGGDWDRKENQRTPDTEASYDLITGKITSVKIDDLMEQRKRFQALADAGGQLDFFKMTWDNNGVQLWRAGKSKQLVIDQPITNYDPKSLQGAVNADGSAWFSLAIDPVNPEAVARKKADPAYIDVFKVGTDGMAVRKARVLATTNGAKYRVGFSGDKFWLVERSPANDRGGKNVAVYTIAN